MDRGISTLLVLCFGALAVLYGLGTLVGVGEEREVHVERVRIGHASTTDADGHPAIVDVRIGVGWYEEDGRRRATELTGFDGEPGDVVETRDPLLPEWLGFQSHRTGQAILALFLGLFGIVPGVAIVIVFLGQ